MKRYLTGLVALAALSPAFALAEKHTGDSFDVKVPTDQAGVIQAIKNVTDWMFSIFLLVAVIFILVAAFNFLTSSGNAEKAGTARKMLVYAIIAVAVAVLSRGIVLVTCSIITGATTGCNI